MASIESICPTSAEIRAFILGELSEEKFERCSLHFESCSLCEEQIRIVETSCNDSLADEVRSLNLKLGDLNHDDAYEVPQKLVELALNALTTTQGLSSTHTITHDPGYRLADQLKKGPCRLGRFELQSELGIGSFGYVFKAYDTKLERIVALKVQRAGTFASQEEVERFLREARSVAQLTHPCIVSIYDTVQSEEEGVCYLVTEFIDGQSLEQKSVAYEFTADETAELIAQIGDALHFAHQRGVIHRDVKPSNVLLDQNGIPHLMDFGLAKRDVDAEDTMTSVGRVMGTPAYMSPEQASGDSHNVDGRSDIYSLGVMLYELLTEHRPFQGNRKMLLLQVLEDEPRPPRQLNASVPRDLETICLKALSKTPSRRYQSAIEMVEDLRRYLRNEPIKARPRGYAERFWRWCRAYPVAASLLLAVPIASVAGFTYLTWLSTHFVHSTALESTRMEADMLEDINEFYSESVIGPLDTDRINVTHEYTTTPHSVPLPFTFMIDAGKRITAHKSGMQVKIYSEYPWRTEGGPTDGFEQRAINALARPELGKSSQRQEGRSYHEFTTIDGRPVLRYARAQIMQESCVGCHNSSKKSPKQDWREGEVGGFLAITRPLQRDIQATRRGLRSAFNVIGVAATLLTGLSFGLLFAARKRTIRDSRIANRA